MKRKGFLVILVVILLALIMSSCGGGGPKPVLVTGITVNGEDNEETVRVGETLQMEVQILPLNASNKGVIWSVENAVGDSSRENLAEITQTGVFTGLSGGTVIVKATAKDGSEVEGIKEITVIESEDIQSVKALLMEHIQALNNKDANGISQTVSDDFRYYDSSRTFDKKKYMDVIYCSSEQDEELFNPLPEIELKNIKVEKQDENTYIISGIQYGKLISMDSKGKYPREFEVVKIQDNWLLNQITESLYCEPSLEITRPIDESIPCYHSYNFIHEYNAGGETSWMIFHNGYDYGFMGGDVVIENPVLAAAGGTVVHIALNGIYTVLTIKGEKELLANGDEGDLYFRYAHIVPLVEVGETIQQGQIIARLARPEEYGASPEVHFDICYVKEGYSINVDPMLLGLNSEIIPILFYYPGYGIKGMLTIQDIGKQIKNEVTVTWADNCTGKIEYYEVKVNDGNWEYLGSFEDESLLSISEIDDPSSMGYIRSFTNSDSTEGVNTISIRAITFDGKCSNILQWQYSY